MTPFIDAGGFRWLRRVFEATRANCQKIVVLRNTDQYTVELGVQHADWLQGDAGLSARLSPVACRCRAGALCRLRRSTRSSSLPTTRLPMWDQQIFSLQAKGCRSRLVFWSKEVRQPRWLDLWMPSFVSHEHCERATILGKHADCVPRLRAPEREYEPLANALEVVAVEPHDRRSSKPTREADQEQCVARQSG